MFVLYLDKGLEFTDGSIYQNSPNDIFKFWAFHRYINFTTKNLKKKWMNKYQTLINTYICGNVEWVRCTDVYNLL